MAKPRFPATERVVSYIAPGGGYFIIPSENGDWKLAQEAIPAMRQDEAAKHCTDDGFHVDSVPAYMELFGDLYKLRNKGRDAERAKEFIRNSIRNQFLNTLTRLIYMPRGKDAIIHGYGTDNKKRIKVNLVGEDGLIGEVLSQEACTALTGKSVEEADEICKYINETLMSVWRLNSKPQKRYESVAGFLANSDGAFLSCVRDASYAYASLGVKRDAQKN